MVSKTTEAFVDADVIVRLIAGDDRKKQERVVALFERVENGELVLWSTDVTIADCVFVLSSRKLYDMSRNQITERLTTLLRLANFKVNNKEALIEALANYSSMSIDFSDLFLAATTKLSKLSLIFSYDRHFDKVSGITRKEP